MLITSCSRWGSGSAAAPQGLPRGRSGVPARGSTSPHVVPGETEVGSGAALGEPAQNTPCPEGSGPEHHQTHPNRASRASSAPRQKSHPPACITPVSTHPFQPRASSVAPTDPLNHGMQERVETPAAIARPPLAEVFLGHCEQGAHLAAAELLGGLISLFSCH